MEIKYRNWQWDAVGSIDVSSVVFDAPLRKDIVARVIRWQQAKSRSGNHSTKTISMVSGTTRKPWGQKETGRARQGSLRSPQFRGGAIVFGPHPRSYEHKLNKKVRQLGCVSSLSFKLQSGLFHVLDKLDNHFEKTSAFAKWLEDREFKSVLFVVSNEQDDAALFKSIRNIPYCDVIKVCGLNVLDIVKHKQIICDVNALKEIEQRFSGMIVSSLVECSVVEPEAVKSSAEQKAPAEKKAKVAKVDEESAEKKAKGPAKKKESEK